MGPIAEIIANQIIAVGYRGDYREEDHRVDYIEWCHREGSRDSA